MQKKDASQRCTLVDINLILVNQILGLYNPIIMDTSNLVCSQDDVRIREFQEVVTRCFRIDSDNGVGYSIPIGAFQDVPNVFRNLDNSETLKVGIPRELYQLILLVRDILERAGYPASDSEILRFMLWTKFPAYIAPNGRFVSLSSASWFYDIAGFLNCVTNQNGEFQCIVDGEISLSSIKSIFTNGDWVPEVKETSSSFEPGNRVSVLTVEVVRRVDDSEDQVDDESTTLN